MQQPDQFPEIEGGSTGPDSGPKQASSRKGFQNPVFPNDAITTCSGFINEIRSHQKGEDTFYFVRAGLIVGSRQNEAQEWEGDFLNCDLLVGSTMKKWAESMIGVGSMLSGIRVNLTIRNLKFTPGLYEGKPILNSKGVLEVMQIGHIDR